MTNHIVGSRKSKFVPQPIPPPPAPHLYPDLIFQANSLPLMPCITCGDQMRLALIEQVRLGFGLHTFECRACGVAETYVVEAPHA